MLEALQIVSTSWPISVAFIALCCGLAITGIVRRIERGNIRRHEIDAQAEVDKERAKLQVGAIPGNAVARRGGDDRGDR